jgi:hypothetical protein
LNKKKRLRLLFNERVIIVKTLVIVVLEAVRNGYVCRSSEQWQNQSSASEGMMHSSWPLWSLESSQDAAASAMIYILDASAPTKKYPDSQENN